MSKWKPEWHPPKSTESISQVPIPFQPIDSKAELYALLSQHCSLFPSDVSYEAVVKERLAREIREKETKQTIKEETSMEYLEALAVIARQHHVEPEDVEEAIAGIPTTAVVNNGGTVTDEAYRASLVLISSVDGIPVWNLRKIIKDNAPIFIVPVPHIEDYYYAEPNLVYSVPRLTIYKGKRNATLFTGKQLRDKYPELVDLAIRTEK